MSDAEGPEIGNQGRSKTVGIHAYSPEGASITLYDSQGYNIGADENKFMKDVLGEIEKKVSANPEDMSDHIHEVWYCVAAANSRFFKADEKMIHEIRKKYSIIRNVWASLKSKVPYQARKKFDILYAMKREELLKKPDSLKWIVPFMKKDRIIALEKDINDNCNSFVNDLVTEINKMYSDAVEYYTELSNKYAMIGFQLDSGDFVASAEIHFDAMQTIRD